MRGGRIRRERRLYSQANKQANKEANKQYGVLISAILYVLQGYRWMSVLLW